MSGAVVLAGSAILYLAVHGRNGEHGVQTTEAVPGKASTSQPQKRVEPQPLPESNAGQPAAAKRDGSVDVAAKPAEATPLPATLDEALKGNAALAKDLGCRDQQAKFSMDYQLRLVAGIRDCLAGRTKSTGRIDFMLHFDNDPTTRRAVGTTMEPSSSELAPEDDAIVLECVRAFHAGSTIQNSEKYGRAKTRHVPSNINLPLEDSFIYKMVREGSYAAGTNFGCEVP